MILNLLGNKVTTHFKSVFKMKLSVWYVYMDKFFPFNIHA